MKTNKELKDILNNITEDTLKKAGEMPDQMHRFIATAVTTGNRKQVEQLFISAIACALVDVEAEFAKQLPEESLIDLVKWPLA